MTISWLSLPYAINLIARMTILNIESHSTESTLSPIYDLKYAMLKTRNIRKNLGVRGLWASDENFV